MRGLEVAGVVGRGAITRVEFEFRRGRVEVEAKGTKGGTGAGVLARLTRDSDEGTGLLAVIPG